MSAVKSWNDEDKKMKDKILEHLVKMYNAEARYKKTVIILLCIRIIKNLKKKKNYSKDWIL